MSDGTWNEVGPGTPVGAWLETRREGEKGTNVCMCRIMSIGDDPEWIEQRGGRTTVTHHTFAAPTHWRWPIEWQPMEVYPDKGRHDATGRWTDEVGPRVELLMEGGRIARAQWRAERTCGGGEAWAWWEDGSAKGIGLYEPKSWRLVD